MFTLNLHAPGSPAETTRACRRFLVLAVALALAPLVHGQTAWTGGRVALNATLSGSVRTSAGAAVANARVTLFRTDLSFFRETRTSSSGGYLLDLLPTGAYRLGAAAIGWDYVAVAPTIVARPTVRDLVVVPQTNIRQ